jgi:hypothetical protein
MSGYSSRCGQMDYQGPPHPSARRLRDTTHWAIRGWPMHYPF